MFSWVLCYNLPWREVNVVDFSAEDKHLLCAAYALYCVEHPDARGKEEVFDDIMYKLLRSYEFANKRIDGCISGLV